MKEPPKMLVLTVSSLADKFKVNGSVARRALRELTAKGHTRQIGDHHHAFNIYTGTISKVAEKGDEGKKGKKAE